MFLNILGQLNINGDNNQIFNSYFSYIDKTVVNLSEVMTTLIINGNNNNKK